jgi:hypothetical protein
VTLIALAVLASAAHDKSESGPPSQDTPLVATLVTIAVIGAVARPVLTGAAHRIRTSSHHAKASFNHRYGHLLPVPGAGHQRHEATTR